MPIISVEGPKVEDINKKREFIADVTKVAADFFEMPQESIIVLLKENEPQNVGVGGKLIADKK
ncbi:tautomerase family protein [Deferribacteraceae bacterium V6Fe1]|nr:tautomerase family protein [Deferribacteraceae bacterium V6Fe1]